MRPAERREKLEELEEEEQKTSETISSHFESEPIIRDGVSEESITELESAIEGGEVSRALTIMAHIITGDDTFDSDK